MKRTPLGRALKIYRATHALKQWELGVKLGCDTTMVSHLERGERQPTPEQRKKLEKLGIVEATQLPDQRAAV